MRLIDGDALHNRVCAIRCGCTPDMCEYEDDIGKYCEFSQFIAYAPTMDAAPIIHAEWIFDRPHHYKCSHCGLMWGDSALMMHYCPKCGSEMSPDYKVCWPDSPKKTFHREDK